MDWLRSGLSFLFNPAGLGLLAALDASFVFFLPFGVDLVLVALVAAAPGRFWLYPIIAAAGSLAGAAVTFLVGRLLGTAGLERLIGRGELERARRRSGGGLILWTSLLALIPPPFPFTPFILANGALGSSSVRFFCALGGARLVRFGLEAALARRYGPQLHRWLQPDVVEHVVTGFIVAALMGSTWGVWRFVRALRSEDPPASA